MMNKNDIQKLAGLARLSLSDNECDSYQKDFEGILTYIDTLNTISINEDEANKALEYNVVREDDIAYEAGVYTDDLLKEMPETQDNYLKVNKIL